jgi:hypothetical protein
MFTNNIDQFQIPKASKWVVEAAMSSSNFDSGEVMWLLIQEKKTKKAYKRSIYKK